ncbi:hypothetical protein SUGI_0593790 [Cryptomeria japonica]|nr:hypothetical protein SUGI_0593790 [Cryptomeria japonica]
MASTMVKKYRLVPQNHIERALVIETKLGMGGSGKTFLLKKNWHMVFTKYLFYCRQLLMTMELFKNKLQMVLLTGISHGTRKKGEQEVLEFMASTMVKKSRLVPQNHMEIALVKESKLDMGGSGKTFLLKKNSLMGFCVYECRQLMVTMELFKNLKE